MEGEGEERQNLRYVWRWSRRRDDVGVHSHMGGGGCLHRHCRHFSCRRALSALSRQGKRRFSYISLSLEWFVTFEFFICSI